MSGLLTGKAAIVTGGTRGIGRSIVLALCREGADCAFTFAQNQTLAESLVKEAGKLGSRLLPVQMDVRDYEGAQALVDKVKNRFGRLDILVNNAGITRDKALMMMSRDDWNAVIDTDLTGVFNVTRASIITFLKQKSGDIVNISSASGLHPLPRQTNYAAAKAGVIGFTRSLAREVAPHNIRVNAVAPGFIETDMTLSMGEKHLKRMQEMIPAGRLGQSDEVARVVIFLLSAESAYITGEAIQIDGGLGLTG